MSENILTDDDALIMTDVMRAYGQMELSPDDRYDNRPTKEIINKIFVEEPEWQTKGACYGLVLDDIFFPPSTFERKEERLAREERAKRICGTCAVREVCLNYALERRESAGIWGGMSESERKALNGEQPRRRAR